MAAVVAACVACGIATPAPNANRVSERKKDLRICLPDSALARSFPVLAQAGQTPPGCRCYLAAASMTIAFYVNSITLSNKKPRRRSGGGVQREAKSMPQQSKMTSYYCVPSKHL